MQALTLLGQHVRIVVTLPRGDRWPECIATMVGHHYWPDAAALTTPTVTIANVLAIGRTMEDDEAEIIDENGWG